MDDMARWRSPHSPAPSVSSLHATMGKEPTMEKKLERAMTRAENAEAALSLVSGALCYDGKVVVPSDEAKYGDAVREITASREKAEAALADAEMQRDAFSGGMARANELLQNEIDRNKRLREALERVLRHIETWTDETDWKDVRLKIQDFLDAHQAEAQGKEVGRE